MKKDYHVSLDSGRSHNSRQQQQRFEKSTASGLESRRQCSALSLVKVRQRTSLSGDILHLPPLSLSHREIATQDNHACRKDRNQRLRPHRQTGAQSCCGEGCHGMNRTLYKMQKYFTTVCRIIICIYQSEVDKL